jgi:sugar transferase (PEP-CTERM system associated)
MFTVILGSDEKASRLYEAIKANSPNNVRMIQSQELGGLSAQTGLSNIIVADSEFKPGSALADTLIGYKLRGVKVETAAECLEKRNRKVWIEDLSPEWLIFANGFNPSKVYMGFKRCFDLLLSMTLLIVFSPLMALVAAAIKLDSKGPAIFSQERVGLLGKRFTLYKFRSMRTDAEKLSGPVWARDNDDRITRLGRFLRKTRLDELPQMFNVLRGDMSFVGPRPERPYFVDLLKEKIRYYDVRHYVKPGITGWAQVMFPYGASVEDSQNKLQYDLYYAKNISLGLDLLVLLKTVKVVVAGEGR